MRLVASALAYEERDGFVYNQPKAALRRNLERHRNKLRRVRLLFGNELPPLHRLKEALLVLVNMEGPVLLEML
jgi:hypothetical protein